MINTSLIKFIPINFQEYKDVCIRFREDSFIVSFGNAANFYETDGQGHERYIDWLKNKLLKNPQWAVHIWLNNEIIGQIELGRSTKDPQVGNVNLYYLKPEFREKGLSKLLDEYATTCLKKDGCLKARLSVSPTNKHALHCYKKMNWKDLGPRPDHPEVLWMEKNL